MGRTVCTEPQFLYKGALYLPLPLLYHTLQQDTEHVRIAFLVIIH